MKRLSFPAAIVLLVLTLSSTLVAQEPGPPAGGSDRNLRDSASDLKGRSNELERIKRDNEKPESRATNPSFPQIKEDFERIQIVNAEVLQAVPGNGSLAYQKMGEAAAEIKKRALRLRSNLFTSEAMKKAKDADAGDEQKDFKGLLAALDGSIVNFTNSPIFQNTNTVNAKDSAKAQKELERIVRLSERIAQEADRLKKQTN